MKKISLKNQQGFSLIEAMIAMVILSVGLLAVGLMQINAMKANTNANSRSDGVAMAQSQMDTLRSLPLDSTQLTDTGGTIDDGRAIGNNDPIATDSEHQAVNPVTGVNGQDYTIFWNIDDNATTNSKTIRIFVYWNDQRFGLNRVIVTSVVGGLYL